MKPEFYWQSLVFIVVYIALMLIYKKITEKGIAKDKLLHGVLSFFIVIFFSLFFHALHVSLIVTLIWSTVITAMIGFTKELYDKYTHHGTYDLKDLWADLIGIGFGVVITIATFIAAKWFYSLDFIVI